MDVNPEEVGRLDPQDGAAIVESLRRLAVAVAELQARFALLDARVANIDSAGPDTAD
jgi:hypothetical protein